jgi:hypothetical protein
MQFTKTFVTLALAASAFAVPTGGSSGSSGAQCCQNVTNWNSVDSDTKGLITGLLGVVISDLNVPIGTGCTPVAILGGVSWYAWLNPSPITKAHIFYSNTNTVTCGQVFAREYSTVHMRFHCPDSRLQPNLSASTVSQSPSTPELGQLYDIHVQHLIGENRI